MSIEMNLNAVRSRIQQSEKVFSRNPGSVFLLAVSKKQSVDKIKEAIQAGQYAFGENYLQEALPKMALLQDQPCEWHFIGTIQRNKTKKIAEQFSWAHTVTHEIIAKRLNDQRPLHLPPLNICIEINVSHESTKSGILSDQLVKLAMYCKTLPRLNLRGLMTIPSQSTSQIGDRTPFRELARLKAELHAQGILLDTLSMGMSGDLEAAIAEGATIVRVGSAIFGSR